MINITQDNHTHAVIEMGAFAGTPVLVHKGGSYPSLWDDVAKARVDRLISVAQFSSGWIVTAWAGRGFGGQIETLSVGTAPTLEEARQLYPAALEAIEEAPKLYARQRDLGAKIRALGPLTREQYEALATEYGVPLKPDADLSSAGVFSFPEYPLADLPRRWIEQLRAVAFEREQEAATKARELREARASEALGPHWEAQMEEMRAKPVLRTERRLVPFGQAPGHWLKGGLLYTVCFRARVRITADDPSVHGSHLLGHEGEMGELLTIEVRGDKQ